MGYSNPANAAMPYLQQIPGAVSPYYQPYQNAGQKSLSTLMQQYQKLISNPSSVMNNIGSGYQQSPGYQFQYNQGMNGANAAAAAGGMLGTPMHQQQASSVNQNLANQDYWNYVNHGMDSYNTGLQGEQGINQMGYQANNAMADAMSSSLMNQAGMAYAGQSNQNQANADFWNSIIGGGTSLLTSPFMHSTNSQGGTDSQSILGKLLGMF